MSRCLVIVLLVVTGAQLSGCGREAAETEPFIRPVRYTRVVVAAGNLSRVFSGVTRAEEETDLSFKVSGTVIERPVSVGDTVEVGDMVARVDPQDYEVRFREAEAGLASAVAELRNAEASYERTRSLYENRNASKSDLDASRAAAESGEARVRAARQQREAARLQLSYTNLTAPGSCSVAATYVELNENVSSGQAVAQLNCGECAEVVVSVPETFIAQVTAGSQVAVGINALPGQVFEGLVTEVGVAAGQLQATYPVTAALREGCADIRSGMAADVRFVVDSGNDSPGRPIVPWLAVGEDRDGRYVFVLEADAANNWFARRRAVELGPVRRGGVEVSSGLQAGELVVTAGVRRIRDDQQVTLLGGPES